MTTKAYISDLDNLNYKGSFRLETLI